MILCRYCDRSSPGPVVSPRGTVGLEMILHTNSHGVFSGFKGRWVTERDTPEILRLTHFLLRYQFMPAKNPFGDCGGNITDSENGFIKSPNYPEKYTTNDQSE